jgi:hypothetical protein
MWYWNEVFYVTQYHPTVVQWYYRFFLVFTMGKMVICSMYVIWKILFRCQCYIKWLYFIYTILFCIFPIIPMYYSYHLWIPPICNTLIFRNLEFIKNLLATFTLLLRTIRFSLTSFRHLTFSKIIQINCRSLMLHTCWCIAFECLNSNLCLNSFV